MIITGGTVFIRQCDQLPQLTLRRATVVMELAEPAGMPHFVQFLEQRVGRGSDVQHCDFWTLEAWANREAVQQLQAAKVDARNDQAAPGWAKRAWSRILERLG